MFRAEILKVRSHLLPWVVYAVLAAALLIPALVLATSAGDDFTSTGFTDVAILVQANVGPLLVIVFGAWMGGAEFRWGTWRIVLGRDPRRVLHLTNKAGAFLFVASVAGAVTFAVGLIAMAGAAAAHGRSLDFSQIFGEAAHVVLTQAVWGLVAFGIAILTRNFAVSVSIVLVYYIVVDAILRFVDQVRLFLLGPALDVIEFQLVGSTGGVSAIDVVSEMSVARAVAVVVVYLVAVFVPAYIVFSRRDIAA